MNCPACNSAEIDSNGLCPNCSCAPSAQEAAPPAGSDIANETPEEAAPPSAPADVPEVPEWRQELSRRLQEIKSKREAAVTGQEQPLPAPEKPEPSAPPPAPRRVRRLAPLANRMQASRAEAASQDAAQPQPEAAGITVEAGSAAPPPAEEILLRPPAEAGQRDVKDLIDSVVSRHAQDEPPAPPPPAFTPLSPPEAGPQPEPDVQRRLEFERSPRPSPGRKPAPSPEPDSTPAWMLPTQETRVPDPMNSGEDKLILLSRTLAGLVDLILIILCAGAMIFAVDILEGIEVWDAVTKFHFALIFLATYFVYSFFFLGMSNQTIGMMLTDLMVVDSASGRAGTPQILVRCLLFPFSLALFGIGLLWGCFDRHTRCLHDLLSGTRVTRIQS